MHRYTQEFQRLWTVAKAAHPEWSQARMARELGLQPSTVTRYLSDSNPPSLTVLKLFSMLLRIPLRLSESEIGYTNLHELHDRADLHEQHLVRALSALKPETRNRLIRAFTDITVAAGGDARYSASTERSETPGRDAVPTTDTIIEASIRHLRAGRTADSRRRRRHSVLSSSFEIPFSRSNASRRAAQASQSERRSFARFTSIKSGLLSLLHIRNVSYAHQPGQTLSTTSAQIKSLVLG